MTHERPPTANDVKIAWANFRAPWDFAAAPVLHLPINQPMRAVDVVVPSDLAMPAAFSIRYATIKLERGYFEGRKANRLVGTVEGTDINVVLEMVLGSE